MRNRKFNVISYNCPACGGSLKIEAGQTQIKCEYCGSDLHIEENETQGDEDTAEAGEKGRNEQSAGARRTRKVIKGVLAFIIVMFVIRMLVFGVLFIKELKHYDSLNSYDSFDTYATYNYGNGSGTEEVNPYENVHVELSGKSPFIQVKRVYSTGKLYGVDFKCDKTEGLSNGDIIRITAGTKSGYKWTESYLDYEISGQDVWVMNVDELSEDDKRFCMMRQKEC